MKTVLRACCTILLLPLLLLYFLAIKVGANRDELLQSCFQLLSILPGKIGSYFRATFAHYVFKHSDWEIYIGFGVLFSQQNTSISAGVYIGPQSNIGMCSIGQNTLLGSGVHVLSGKNQHNFSDPNIAIKDQGGHFEKLKIGDNCWIGNAAIIMADVGSSCVVAAGSVVIKDVPENSIVAGNPAKVIGPTFKHVNTSQSNSEEA